ncbi:O-antigen ligase family protein [Carboxylicivirga taeanensis]|uniref:O-antigen ligase family protein n=1 Tax=Carboxylicivirga taeanensis TaxID=1416875 RepID=UPI003F6DF937
MLELIKKKPVYLSYFILCFATIAYGGSISLVAIPIFTFLFNKHGQLLIPFFALLLVLPLADSSFAFFVQAYQLRPILLVLIGLIVFSNPYIVNKVDWSLYAFIPYFVILGYYVLDVHSFIEVLRPISYFLVIVITPVITKHILVTHKDIFLKGLILLYTLVFVLSFLTIGENAALQSYGRFSGIFRNPNALGIFSFLFFMLSTIIFKFQGHLFTKIERYFVIGIILAGVIYSRSRSGMFAIGLFWLSLWAYERWQLKGIVFLGLTAIIINYAIPFEEVIRGIGLGDFLRLESIEAGSGRKVAFEHALDKIMEAPFSGNGIGFTEQYFSESKEVLSKKGHVGNVHNSFLSVWLDYGLFGLLSFIYAWFSWFKKTSIYTTIVLSVALAVLFSANIEMWLVGSLNHVTIQLIIILSLLSSNAFYEKENLNSESTYTN